MPHTLPMPIKEILTPLSSFFNTALPVAQIEAPKDGTSTCAAFEAAKLGFIYDSSTSIAADTPAEVGAVVASELEVAKEGKSGDGYGVADQEPFYGP